MQGEVTDADLAFLDRWLVSDEAPENVFYSDLNTGSSPFRMPGLHSLGMLRFIMALDNENASRCVKKLEQIAIHLGDKLGDWLCS
ncbi:MAG: hypothetical protein ACT4N2_09995 [Hyphomicrobium sp.]